MSLIWEEYIMEIKQFFSLTCATSLGCHLQQEVVFDTTQESPGLLMPCCMVLPADNGVKSPMRTRAFECETPAMMYIVFCCYLS